MTLLDINENEDRIRLPLDCEAEYFPNFLTTTESDEIFEHLCGNYDLSPGTIITPDGKVYPLDFGKHIFADADLLDFTHLPEALGRRTALPPLLEMVKERLKTVLQMDFNVCVCVHYRNGEVGADFHTDMPEFGRVSFITVISLGVQREFVFRSKEDASQELRLILERGSLLTMGEDCQERYEHGVPIDPNCKNPRISLSYRPFGWD